MPKAQDKLPPRTDMDRFELLAANLVGHEAKNPDAPRLFPKFGLRFREELFRVLATNIPQLVFRSKRDGARTWASPQWVAYTGISAADSLGFGWLKGIHPDDRPPTPRAWADAEAQGTYSVEHRTRRASDCGPSRSPPADRPGSAPRP